MHDSGTHLSFRAYDCVIALVDLIPFLWSDSILHDHTVDLAILQALMERVLSSIQALLVELGADEYGQSFRVCGKQDSAGRDILIKRSKNDLEIKGVPPPVILIVGVIVKPLRPRGDQSSSSVFQESTLSREHRHGVNGLPPETDVLEYFSANDSIKAVGLKLSDQFFPHYTPGSAHL